MAITTTLAPIAVPAAIFRLTSLHGMPVVQFIAFVFMVVIVWELCALILKAGRTRFWYDELFTYHISGLSSFSVLRKALGEGIDAMPQGYYIMVCFARKLPGDIHVTLRLPSILGYILSLLGVYWFVADGLTAPAALAAALLVVLSPFRKFALQARSYSLLVGFLAIAAVLWQRADEGWFMAPLLALFLILAVSCHYLGVVTIGLFGSAELCWTLLSHQVRWGVWLAFLLGTIPFLLGLPYLLRFRDNYARKFFARPTWSTVLETYGEYLGLDYKLVIALVLSFSVVIVGRYISLPEAVLVAGFLLYPAFLAALTKILKSGYTPRYGWPVILGLAVGSICLLHNIWLSPLSGYLLGAFLIALIVHAGREISLLPPAGSTKIDYRWTSLAQITAERADIPVIIGGGLVYMEVVEYSPPELRARLLRIVDVESAGRLSGWDTADRATLTLAQYAPLPIESLETFSTRFRSFYLYSGGAGDWFTQYVMEKKYRLQLIWKDKDADAAVYFAEEPL